MNSIRFRITALVAIVFAAVAVVGSMLFVGWFEDRLVAEVRADDSLELDRQIVGLDLLNDAAEEQPGFVESSQILEPDISDPVPLIALIPDDGTQIQIANEAGELITDTEASRRIFNTPAPDSAPPTTEFLLPPEDLALAVDGMLPLVAEMETQLSPAALVEYEPSIRFLREAFGDPTVFAPAEQSDPTNLPGDDLDAAMAALVFGRDEAPVDVDVRTITTIREASIIGLPVVITAESKVTSIDAALDSIVGTLRTTVPILVALVAALTYLATGRALRPVAEITNQVESITSTHTGDRVPEPNTGDEISHLAVTMNKMLGRLESASTTQRRFVSDVSHELRTPSAVIRAEMEAGLADPDNDWAKTTESVLGEQTRLTELVDDLLLLASMDEGGELTKSEIDLDQLVQDEAKRGWAHPVSVLDVQPVRILGDERRLSRAIENLVANANRHAQSQVKISLQQIHGEAVLWVDDDGQGVRAEEQERIFERFARLDESRQRDAGGSGLGLAIVKEVARAHGGDASVSNNSVGGARFELRIASGV